MQVGEAVQLVHQAFGMDPAEGMPADIELSGVVADDDGVGQEAVRLDAAPQGCVGGDERIRGGLAGPDGEPIEMGRPGRTIGEDPLRGRPGGRSRHRGDRDRACRPGPRH
jgi:hypothetical protein